MEKNMEKFQEFNKCRIGHDRMKSIPYCNTKCRITMKYGRRTSNVNNIKQRNRRDKMGQSGVMKMGGTRLRNGRRMGWIAAHKARSAVRGVKNATSVARNDAFR